MSFRFEHSKHEILYFNNEVKRTVLQQKLFSSQIKPTNTKKQTSHGLFVHGCIEYEGSRCLIFFDPKLPSEDVNLVYERPQGKSKSHCWIISIVLN